MNWFIQTSLHMMNSLKVLIRYLFHHLIPKGAACRNSTFWMTATSVSLTSFIQRPFLTKIIGLNSNSNLISVVKISAQSKMS